MLKSFSFLFAVLLATSLHAQTTQEDTTIHKFVEAMPIFPGGEPAFIKYLTDVPDPRPQGEDTLKEVLRVQFVVEKNGTIGNIVVVKGSDERLKEAAIEHFKKMPVWKKPAYQHGVPVRIQMVAPIKFKQE